MTLALILVLGLLAATIAMFALNRPRMDAAALIMLTLLPFTGAVSVPEALAGFSDPNVVLIAALFVIGEGLVRTGVAQRLGDAIGRRAGGSETRLLVLLMLAVAGVGSVMSSTGVVALFIPIVLRAARNARVPAGRLLMPMSVAALISGMLTLVATPPNLVVQGALVRQGLPGFGFFDIAWFGLPVLVVAILHMLLARRWLGGAEAAADEPAGRPRLTQWVAEYGLAGRAHRVRLFANSPWVGQRLAQLDLRKTLGVDIVAIERRRRFQHLVLQPLAETTLEAGDMLFLDLQGGELDWPELCQRSGLLPLPMSGEYFVDHSQAIGMAELMVPANSALLGRTLLQAGFRSRYDLTVVGLKRGQTTLSGKLLEEPLQVGDTLLVAGPWRAIRRLPGTDRSLIVLNVPLELEDVVPEPDRAPFALGALLAVVVLMVTGWVPNVHAALLGCLLLGLFGCIDMNSAYRAIHWQSLFLIVGMLPFALALQNTGGIALAADALLGLVGDASPRLVLVALFVVTAVLGMFISNTATAVLMAPVSLALAANLGLSPYPFAMIVALAASAAFMTPVSSPVNTLVVVPGRYRFMDFVKVGVPLTLAVLVLAVTLVPVVFPFQP